MSNMLFQMFLLDTRDEVFFYQKITQYTDFVVLVLKQEIHLLTKTRITYQIKPILYLWSLAITSNIEVYNGITLMKDE